MGMRTRNSGSVIRAAGGLIFTAGLALACTDTTGPAPTYTVGGTVSGLAGSGLVLRDNGGDDLPVSANGAVAFATPLASGAAYSVTVFAQPSSPAQTASSPAGSGTMASANVTTVAIVCATNTYTVGGTVSGLVGSGLVLRNNGGDDLAGVRQRRRQLCDAGGQWRHAIASRCSPSRPAPPRPVVVSGRQRDDGPGQRHDRRDRVRDEYRHGGRSGDGVDHRSPTPPRPTRSTADPGTSDL